MELEQMPQPGPGLYGSDREVFERVWRRVMEAGGGESPVEVIPEGAGLPAPFPEVSAPAAPLLLPPDPEDAIRCLGPASSRYGEALQQFIQAELQDAATYRALARRGRSGSRFATLASQERRHAKRLSTAYFLISGVRYLPADRAAPRLESTYLGTLRARFQAEQRGEAVYRAAAEHCQDPCLQALYLELAEEELGHSRVLRDILETI